MEIIIYLYFAINLFMAGYHTNENLRWESKTFTVGACISLILFGCVLFPIAFLFYAFLPKIGWIVREIKFQYRFRFTKYWDNIILNDDYSEEFKSREEKLKRMIELTKGASKQIQRHQKIIQEKYGSL